MNVYLVRSVCEREAPGKGLRQVYAAVDQTYRNINTIDHFDGKPYPKRWRPVTLRFDKPRLPRADFVDFDWQVLLCGERAMRSVGQLLRSSGELFPVKVAGDKGEYHLHNVTQLLKDALNAEQSEFRVVSPDYKPLRVPAFHPERIAADISLFKIPQNFGAQIYCVERTGKPEDGEFKALVEHHGLKGLEFKLVWSDAKRAKEKTPIAKPRHQPAKPMPPPHPGGSDRALKPDEMKDIALSVTRGYKHLKLPPATSPQKTQKAIRDLIDQIVLGKKKVSDHTRTDLAVNLGSLWGHSVCTTVGWEWCFAKVGGREFYAIAPPNRAHVLAPMAFLQQQLRKRPPEDNTSLLLFNMIKAGKLPAAKAKAYLHVG